METLFEKDLKSLIAMNLSIIEDCHQFGYHEMKMLRLGLHQDFCKLGLKAGFNPSQLRVPAGSPDGGQWTDDERYIRTGRQDGNFRDFDEVVKRDEPAPGNDEVRFVIRRAGQNGKVPNQVNIFVGGALDQTLNGNVENSKTLRQDSLGDNYYTTQDSRSKINEFIKTIPKDKKINIIGHSWGGDTAAEVVADNPGRVCTLITIDPVSTFFRTPSKKIKKSVGMWININATGNPALGKTIGDDVAEEGGWHEDPQEDADIYIEAQKSHEEVDAMMNYPDTDGRTPQEILNGIQPMDKLIEDILKEGNEDYHLKPVD